MLLCIGLLCCLNIPFRFPGTVRLQIDYTPRQDAAAQQHYALCTGGSDKPPLYPLPSQEEPLLISETFSVPPPAAAEPLSFHTAEPFSFHRNWRVPVFIQGELSAAPLFIGVSLTAV